MFIINFKVLQEVKKFVIIRESGAFEIAALAALVILSASAPVFIA